MKSHLITSIMVCKSNNKVYHYVIWDIRLKFNKTQLISWCIFKQYIILFNHLKLASLEAWEVCFISQIKLLK